MKGRLFVKYIYAKIRETRKFHSEFSRATSIGFIDQLSLTQAKDVSNFKIFGKKVKITDAFWHNHSLNELFYEGLYHFPSEKTNPLIIDCGANIGLSVIYFKHLYPDAKVIAFEADPGIFLQLRSNIDSFNFNNIELYNKAVWTSEGSVLFDASGALSGSMFTVVDGTEAIEIPSIDLRKLLLELQQNGTNVDLLKIDIEGAELAVIEHLAGALQNVQHLFVEYHRLKGKSNPFWKFIKVLEDAGYTIYIKEAWNNLPKPFMNNDYNPLFDLQLNIFAYRNR